MCGFYEQKILLLTDNMVYFLVIMKKFFHGLVLFAVLIGTFAPISFSVAPHVNVASAGGDTTATTFNKRILVEKTSTINKFKLTTYVTYTFPNSSIPNGVHLGADRIDLKYVVKQISPIQKTIYNSEEFDELQGNFAESIFALGVETPVEQEITLPDDGVYEGYFWEDYNLTSDNIESSKLIILQDVYHWMNWSNAPEIADEIKKFISLNKNRIRSASQNIRIDKISYTPV